MAENTRGLDRPSASGSAHSRDSVSSPVDTEPPEANAEPPRFPAPIQGRSFTIRGLFVGLMVGLIICFSNMYFGLQTGWISSMTMPASLLGFGFFKTISRHLKFPFSPVENVLVQSVAGSMALMPLGCGFVGVVSPSRQEIWRPNSPAFPSLLITPLVSNQRRTLRSQQ